jgi:hypothetical protein
MEGECHYTALGNSIPYFAGRNRPKRQKMWWFLGQKGGAKKAQFLAGNGKANGPRTAMVRVL